MKNEYNVNKEEIISWSKGYLIRSALGITWICLYVILFLIGVALITLLALGGGDPLKWGVAVIAIILPIYRLFFSQYVFARSKYKMLSKTYGVTEWIRTIELTDEDIVVTDHTSLMRFKYSNLRKIIDRDKKVLLLFTNNLSVRLYKDKFTEGTWQECKEMLESKIK